MDTQNALRPMTEGEIAVGMTFNPSGDEKVAKLKALFAEAFDIVEQSVPEDFIPFTRDYVVDVEIKSIKKAKIVFE